MSRARRATVLFAVLLVVTLAALAGTTVLVAADAGVSSAQATLKRTQVRALAWSGVQAVMAELADQREALLLGSAPLVTDEWTLFTDENGRRGVVRLVEPGVDGLIASECGKLDLNAASEGMLSKVDLIGPDLAARIVEARNTRRFTSVEDLLRVEGVTPELLYGVPAVEGRDRPRSERVRLPGSAADESGANGLAGAVTVFSFDPNVQAGVGGDEYRGRLRINIGMAWSDGLRTAITERFGAEAATVVEQAMTAGQPFRRDSDVVRKLRELRVAPEDWASVLDAFTTSDEPYLVGRVDLSSASEEILACVPGIDVAAAAAIVEARGRLDNQTRLSVTWPLAQGILSPDQFEQAVNFLGARSMVWRVRVEAGTLASEGNDELQVLGDRVVLDAVIDVSSERPRVAYLRDVTSMPAAMAMYARLPAPEPAEEEMDAPESPAGASATRSTPGAPAGGPGGANQGRSPTPLPPRPGAGRGSTPTAPSSRPAGRATGEGPDRRVGRWTIGKQGSGGGS